MRTLTAEELRDLLAALAPRDDAYDPAECMVREPFHSPGYHTALKGGSVHATRSSLGYAVALLDTGEEWRMKRACEVLDRVIGLQDQNPESRTYGIWSWFMEEPLDKMSPPDWNWADFNGTQLLQVALDHRDRLPAEVAKRVDESIYHAARSIQRRNVGPAYTNIGLMGTYVTYVAAERYHIPDLLEYAQARLQRFYDYTLEQDGFTEFNSPTYTIVAITELTRMRMHIRNAEAQKLIAVIHDIGWRDISRHFHAPTAHSRCYATLLQPGTLGFIQRACRGDVRFFPEGALPPSLEAQRLDVECPPKYRSRFASLTEPRDEVQVFIKGAATQSGLVGGGVALPVIGTTHLEPAFALGSTNRHHFWNQSRPLVAYWGDKDSPCALQVRFLHDFYDYTSAQFFSMQSGGALLGGVCFVTDFGDTHPSLDVVKNASIRARDLRLRFEFFNMPGAGTLPRLDLGVVNALDLNSIWLDLAIPYAKLGAYPARGEVSREGERLFLDVILYQGEEREINFGELNDANVLLALRLRDKSAADQPAMRISHELTDDRLRAEWKLGQDTLSLEMLRKPGKRETIHRLAPIRL
jgi:hypothetical protein